MEPLYHATALRMEHSCRRSRKSKRRADSSQDGGGKLSTPVGGKDSQNRKSRDPGREKAWAQDAAEIEPFFVYIFYFSF